MPELLGYRPDDLDIDGFGKPSQLIERVGDIPCLSRLFDRDEQRLFWPCVGGNGLWFGLSRYRMFLPDSASMTDGCCAGTRLPWPATSPSGIHSGWFAASWALHGYAGCALFA